MKTLAATACLILCVAGESRAYDHARHRPHSAGLSTSLTLDYDGSRHRTSAFHLGAEVEWGSADAWLDLSLDAYTDFSSDWRLRSDGFASLEAGYALHRDHQARLYVNATLEYDAHSLIATHGGDLTPEINFAKGLTEDWWIGASIAATLATSPDEGNRTGYLSTTLWITWLCGWLEDDSLSLSLWAAGNEVPGDDKSLFISLEYIFSLSDHLEASLGIGTDPISPWDHLGIYAQAGLTWYF